uniref:Uncharacterized protein n=1 Tax=Panagrellus redivivus TaxID=6233 RepID=A0A7E4UNC9_PANRE
MHADLAGLIVGESVLQTVTQEEDQRKGFTELVGTSNGTGSENTAELVEHPVFGRSKALQMVLRSTSHICRLLQAVVP